MASMPSSVSGLYQAGMAGFFCKDMHADLYVMVRMCVSVLVRGMSAKLCARNVRVEKRNNRQSKKRNQKQSGVQRLRSSRGGSQFQGAPGGGSRVD